jgi:transcription initiation factor TFIID subunit 6
LEHVETVFESNDEKDLEVLWENLSVDAGIGPLLPHFLQLMADRLTRCLDDTGVVQKVALLGGSLVHNISLPVEFYVHSFLRTVMTVILRYESGDEFNDDIQARQLGGHFLAELCRRCAAGFPALWTVALNALIRGWLNPDGSLASQFGALAGISALGTKAILRILPYARTYVNLLKKALEVEGRQAFARNILEFLTDMVKSEEANWPKSDERKNQMLVSDITSTLSRLKK